MEHVQIAYMEGVVSSYPFPIASAVKHYQESDPKNSFAEWEILSKELLLPNLLYLSHMLLADLVASGHKPPHIYPKIVDILNRPTYGRYINFLRETARLYRDQNIQSAFPELIDFILASEVDRTLIDGNKALLSELVDYRNQISHGRIGNQQVQDQIVDHVRQLTLKLLEHLQFLTKYPLITTDGISLIGGELPASIKDSSSLVAISCGERRLRPLLLKLKGNDLLLLEEADIRDKRLAYKGTSSFVQLKKKDLNKGDGQVIFEELAALLQSVQAVTTLLPYPDWDTFSERASLITDRTLTNYKEMGKFVPSLFINNPAWSGQDNIFSRFLQSDRSLLAISGPSGSGKSAQVSQLASQAASDAHAILFINAQRFTFAATVEPGINPFPAYFANILYYENPLGKEELRRLIKTAPTDKQVIFFIDAINEVDGLMGKWNRFVAIEKLLEWVSQIAQPGLKIVLSFRVDLYEEFNYLEPDDEFMPTNLLQIAFPGNHPRKPWVWELESFSAIQAEQLYHLLQSEPENGKGMAPLMSWQQIQDGLGESFLSVTANPLVFMLFLRAHHKESYVTNKDPEAIFNEYANRITGSAEIRQWPWYKKAWGFIKNGNITKKEQLISDLFYKMSKVGNTAILFENNIYKPKNKKEKRLYSALNTPNNPALKDLTEGKMIVDETIEYEVNNITNAARRVSFVAEAILPASEIIEKKIKNKNSFLTGTYSILFAIILIIFIMSYFKIVVFKQIYHLKGITLMLLGATENPMDLIIVNYSRLFASLLLLIVPFAFFTVMEKICEIKRNLISKIGLLQSVSYNTFERKYQLNMLIMAFILFGLCFLAPFIYFPFTKKFDFVIVVIGLCIIIPFLPLLVINQSQIIFFIYHKHIPTAIYFSYHEKIVQYYSKNKITLIKSISLQYKKILLAMMMVCITILISYILWGKSILPVWRINNIADFMVFHTFRKLAFVMKYKALLYIVILALTGLISLIIMIKEYLNYVLTRHDSLTFLRKHSLKSIKSKLINQSLMLLSVMFVIMTVYVIWDYYKKPSINVNEIIGKEMILNTQQKIINQEKSTTITSIILLNSTLRIGDLSKRYPNLRELKIDDAVAFNSTWSFVNSFDNLMIRIYPSNNNITNNKRVEPILTEKIVYSNWINKEYAKAILSFEGKIIDSSGKLSLVQRMFANAGSFDPSLLKNADSLIWLRIRNNKSTSVEWYESLLFELSHHNNNLQTLEISESKDDDYFKLLNNPQIGIYTIIRKERSNGIYAHRKNVILFKLKKFIEKRELSVKIPELTNYTRAD